MNTQVMVRNKNSLIIFLVCLLMPPLDLHPPVTKLNSNII